MSIEPIENKVAKSGLITLEISSFVPKEPILEVDINDHLWEGIALREKDFRDFVKNNDWGKYQDAFVSVHCSADAIIPNWAYMLLASELTGRAREIFFGTPDEFQKTRIVQAIKTLDTKDYEDERVIVKGCGNEWIDYAAYGYITTVLKPVVKSLMFGEPCSTVPIYKKR